MAASLISFFFSFDFCVVSHKLFQFITINVLAWLIFAVCGESWNPSISSQYIYAVTIFALHLSERFSTTELMKIVLTGVFFPEHNALQTLPWNIASELKKCLFSYDKESIYFCTLLFKRISNFFLNWECLTKHWEFGLELNATRFRIWSTEDFLCADGVFAYCCLPNPSQGHRAFIY